MFQCATQNIVGRIFSTWAMKKLQAISKLMNWNKDIQGVQLFLALDLITALPPQSKSTFAMKMLSSDVEGTKVKLYNDDNNPSIRLHEQRHKNLQPGKYVACLYHRVWCCNRTTRSKQGCLYQVHKAKSFGFDMATTSLKRLLGTIYRYINHNCSTSITRTQRKKLCWLPQKMITF